MDAHNYDPDSANCQACPERAACARVNAALQHPRAEVIDRMVQDAIAAHADEHDFDVSRVNVGGLAYHGMRLAGADPERPLTDPLAGFPPIPASEVAKLRRAADTVARMVDTTAIAVAAQVDADTTELIAAGALMAIAERADAFLDFQDRLQDRLRELTAAARAADTATPPALAPMGRA